VYETKGPYSAWSQPFSLRPGESTHFNIAYPLLFRRVTADNLVEMYTLPAGSYSEYRVPLSGGKAQLFQAKGAQAPAPPVPGSAPLTTAK
jgi:hypothetical protein